MPQGRKEDLDAEAEALADQLLGRAESWIEPHPDDEDDAPRAAKA